MSSKEKTKAVIDYPSGAKPDPKIAAAISRRLKDGKLPCVRAFEIARELSVPLLHVGYTADLLRVRISACQLGLFGYEPQRCIVQVPVAANAEMDHMIDQNLTNGRLPCAAAFTIAKALRIPRMDVSSACQGRNIKVCTCQLGAFG